jgi:hypothetical protein
VFGTSPGRRGQVLKTPIGDIPVYNNVRAGLDAGHRFNCGVVYLPPSAARDGVAELIRVNSDFEKIFIVTEKMSVHDAREVRATGRHNHVDIFGGNSLGVADAWNQVRIGGALDGVDLKALVARYAAEYADYRSSKRAAGSLDLQMIPGINHPVFRDRPVNYDPREVWVRELFTQRGEYNVFHEYYRALVEALYKTKVSRNVYCVNIHAVISALLLKILWRPYSSGTLSGGALETAAFTIFLYARMLGCAAEIDDHLNRGRNMDTRTPASQCRFVA